MKKTGIKVLAMSLSLATLFNVLCGSVPVKCINRQSDSSAARKVALAAGVGVGVLLAVGTIIYLCSQDDDTEHAPTKPSLAKNANLTNTKKLCFWHSFLQQMYSLKSFRDFVDHSESLRVANKSKTGIGTSDKIKAFKEIFELMGKHERIGAQTCLNFAEKLLPPSVVGHQNDINEIIPNFIEDVFEEYDRFCRDKRSARCSNLLNMPISLEKDRAKLQDLCNDKQEFRTDVSIIENQFAIFVNRTSISGNRVVKDFTPVDFGDGTAIYTGRRFAVTAVSIHNGEADSGHYYTYKKESDGNWYKYNDTQSEVECVNWNVVVNDAAINCTMLTFTAMD